MASWTSWFPDGVAGRMDGENNFHLDCVLGDKRARGLIRFRPAELPSDVAKFAGGEYAGAFLDEVTGTYREMGLPEDVYTTLLMRLRQPNVGRFHIILAFNPPPPGHWVAEEFKLPPTESPEKSHFVIPPRENAANLPPEYYENLRKAFKLKGDWAARFLDGERVPIGKQTAVFDSDIIRDNLTEWAKPPLATGLLQRDEKSGRIKLINNKEGAIQIWEWPNPNDRYVLGSDSGEGLQGNDPSCSVVLSRSTGAMVAKWHGHLMPRRYAKEIAMLGWYYNDAFACPEVEPSAAGRSTCDALENLGYTNIYMQRREQNLGDPMIKKYGIPMSRYNKSRLVGYAREVIEERRFKIPDKSLLLELLTFVEHPDGSMRADEGTKDDMCFMPGTLVSTEKGTQPIESINRGDVVTTHTGNYGKVDEILCRSYTGDMVNLSVCGMADKISCTPNHPILVTKRKQSKSGQLWSSKRKNGFVSYVWENPWEEKGEWVDANKIQKGDYTFIPKRINLPKSELSNDELYFLGWYLSDGYLSDIGQLKIVFGEDEKHCAEIIVDIINRITSNHPTEWITGKSHAKHIKYCSARLSHHKTARCWEVHACNRWLTDFISMYCPKRGGQKTLSTELYNRSGLLPLAVGFLEGDGSQKNYRESIGGYGSNHSVVRQIKQILLDGGVWSTEMYSRSLLVLHLCAQSVNRLLLQYPGNMYKFVDRSDYRIMVYETPTGYWTPIQKITTSNYTGNVYNFSVPGDNSYVAGGIAVHNCMAWLCALEGYAREGTWIPTVYVPGAPKITSSMYGNNEADKNWMAW